MNLLTHYMGLRLRNPLIASASPLTSELATLRAMNQRAPAQAVLVSLRGREVPAPFSRSFEQLRLAHASMLRTK